MTDNYQAAPAPPLGEPAWASEPLLPPAGEDQPGTADVVKDQAADLGQSGVEAGKHTAGVAQEQASQVAAEAARQGRDLLRQAQGQLGDQAAAGQQRVATELLSLSAELSSMAEGSTQQGVAAGLARQAASRAHGAGKWLEDRSPTQLVDEVQAFARRRPGTFLALAVGAGLAAGRLTRGLTAGHGDGSAPPAAALPGGPPDTSAPWTDPSAGAPYAAAAEDINQPVRAVEAAYPPAPDIVVADDGSAVPVVDGLPATGGGSAWDVDPQADQLGTLGRPEIGSRDFQ
jgi:hypothetical protein